jgi:hypothetical protein
MKAVILVLLIATALSLVRPSVLAQAKLMSLADHIAHVAKSSRRALPHCKLHELE